MKGQRNKSGWEEQEPDKNKDWEKINTDGKEFSAGYTCTVHVSGKTGEGEVHTFANITVYSGAEWGNGAVAGTLL